MNEIIIIKDNIRKNENNNGVITFEDENSEKCELYVQNKTGLLCLNGTFDPFQIRMTQRGVAELLPYLQYFVEYGVLPTYEQKELYSPCDFAYEFKEEE